ncbi:MAG TPA: TetR/AcrR family transcriptional regulator [Planctomycetota bacterium]|jgi:AcrR family transcriptional regulator|nr:TetR/AcrR family transcriptional regulator [Planctomycetota bacterium]
MNPVAADAQRPRILAAAAEIFAREGYRNTDLQDVADVLAIGKGSVYRRFPTKQDLFLATVDDGMRRLKECVDAAIEGVDDPLDRLARAVRAYLAFFDAEPQLAELVILERAEFRDRKKPTYFQHREVNVERWRLLYARLMDEKRVRRMPIDRITDVISNLVYGTMFTNHFAGRTKSFDEQATDILDIVFHGILPPEQPNGTRRNSKQRKERA